MLTLRHIGSAKAKRDSARLAAYLRTQGCPVARVFAGCPSSLNPEVPGPE
jgi:hypothetical protein